MNILFASAVATFTAASAHAAPPATDDMLICQLVIPAIVVDTIASYHRGLDVEAATASAADLRFPNLRESVRPYVSPLAANLPRTLYNNQMIGKVADSELIEWHIEGCMDSMIGDPDDEN